jgi:hypothetical protein
MKKLALILLSLAVIVATAGHCLAQHYYGGGSSIAALVS